MDFHKAVNDFCEGYFSTCRRSSKTQHAYRTDLGQFEEFVGGGEAFESVGADAVEHWARILLDKEYASVSIRRKFAALRVFYSYWVRKGILESSPFWRIRLDLAPHRFLPRTLTSLDMKKLMEAVWSDVCVIEEKIREPRDKRFLRLRNLVAIELLFATGMRVGELVTDHGQS